jgi:hypothetical protein
MAVLVGKLQTYPSKPGNKIPHFKLQIAMSKKQKVMEALLTSDVNLNKEDLLWINSHLPNEEGTGQYKKIYKFDHDAENLFVSIGITDEIAQNVASVFAGATKNLLTRKDYNMSMAVEEVLNNSSEIPYFEALIVSKLLRDSIDKIQEETEALPKTLLEILKELRKRNNED